MIEVASESRIPFSQMIAAQGQAAGGRQLWSMPDHTGEEYKTVLKHFHTCLKPRTYLEIGVQAGWTLELASCASIGVDPKFDFKTSVWANKALCLLYQMASDEFFANHNPSKLLGRAVDMALLDGMHWFEFLLRDFINVEKHGANNSIIFMHDCLPTDTHVGRRDMRDSSLKDLSKHPDWWAGDVWKALAIIIEHRPDLQIMLFDAPPTGLVAITNLDPASTLLSDRYFELVGAFKNRTLNEHGSDFLRGLPIVSSRDYTTAAALSACFWL